MAGGRRISWEAVRVPPAICGLPESSEYPPEGGKGSYPRGIRFEEAGPPRSVMIACTARISRVDKDSLCPAEEATYVGSRCAIQCTGRLTIRRHSSRGSGEQRWGRASCLGQPRVKEYRREETKWRAIETFSHFARGRGRLDNARAKGRADSAREDPGRLPRIRTISRSLRWQRY